MAGWLVKFNTWYLFIIHIKFMILKFIFKCIIPFILTFNCVLWVSEWCSFAHPPLPAQAQRPQHASHTPTRHCPCGGGVARAKGTRTRSREAAGHMAVFTETIPIRIAHAHNGLYVLRAALRDLTCFSYQNNHFKVVDMAPPFDGKFYYWHLIAETYAFTWYNVKIY